MTPYEQFISKHKLDIAPKQPLSMTPEEIRRAGLDEVNELMRLRRVEELIEARGARCKIDDKQEEVMELEEGECEPEKP